MKSIFLFVFTVLTVCSLKAQDKDMLSLLGEEPTTEYANHFFKTTRVVNGHSIENTGSGVLDVRISHRFIGGISSGAYELFGLDAATIRIGVDYGVSDRLMIGAGRSSIEKTYDGFVKYRFLQQSKGKRNMPFSAAYLGAMSVNTLKSNRPADEYYFSHRLNYVHQLLLARKFSDGFTLQLSPTLVHRNLVATKAEKNDVISIGIGVRQRLSRRVTVNAEYFYVLPDQLGEGYRNSLSLGFDIETGGHVFQFHFTNSAAMIEKGFIAETQNNWADGDINFGFNISRVFTIVKPKVEF